MRAPMGDFTYRVWYERVFLRTECGTNGCSYVRSVVRMGVLTYGKWYEWVFLRTECGTNGCSLRTGVWYGMGAMQAMALLLLLLRPSAPLRCPWLRRLLRKLPPLLRRQKPSPAPASPRRPKPGLEGRPPDGGVILDASGLELLAVERRSHTPSYCMLTVPHMPVARHMFA